MAGAAHSWRVAKAGHRSFRANRIAGSTDLAASALADLENLPAESPGGDRGGRFFYRADNPPASVVRVPGDRASTAKSSSFRHHGTSDLGMGCSTSCGSLFGS